MQSKFTSLMAEYQICSDSRGVTTILAREGGVREICSICRSSSVMTLFQDQVSFPGADRYVLFCGPMFVPGLVLSQLNFMVK